MNRQLALDRAVSRAAAAGLATFEKTGDTTVRVTCACRVRWIARVCGGWLVYADRSGFRYAVANFTSIDDAIHLVTHRERVAA